MQINQSRKPAATFSRHLFIPALALFSILAFHACNDPYVFREKKAIPKGQWSYADTLDFKIPVSDTTALYNLYAQFTHSDTFPNQNLYLKLYTRFPDNRRISRLRSFEFFDLQGHPLGKCSGGKCTSKVLLQNNVYFNLPGDYVITMEQFTRRDPMPGISDVELLLEKTDKKR